ncbi:MAG: hypothetical protein WAK93_01585 [Solirubrobacteraceae bacterium]
MPTRRTLALGGALLALCLVFASAALAAGTKVSVRVEGVKRTLLSTTSVTTHSGSITKDGTPAGICPSSSAAGALDIATKHRWGGTFDTKFQELELTTILGESWPFTQDKYYWGIWVNNRYASAGMCQITPHKGDRILFAVDSDTTHEHPLGLSAPARATRGKAFKVKVVSYSDAGKATPLAGASIKGVSGTTDNRGALTVTDTHAGKLRLQASAKSHIRSATETVTVKA